MFGQVDLKITEPIIIIVVVISFHSIYNKHYSFESFQSDPPRNYTEFSSS